jgi:hypothetical protein
MALAIHSYNIFGKYKFLVSLGGQQILIFNRLKRVFTLVSA